MLTRSGVAKRLGWSIATVRRMEGHELHPVQDERGVHRFDPDEVAEVARSRAFARPTEPRKSNELSAELKELRRERLTEERSFLEWQREQVLHECHLAELRARAEQQRQAELEQENTRLREELEARERGEIRASLLAELETLTPRQLARISDEDAEELVELLDELEE